MNQSDLEERSDYAAVGGGPAIAAVVDRFYTLVRRRYFDDSRFFRVVPGRWAQFGIAGNPDLSALFRDHTIPDDPPRTPNVRGAVAYAFAEKDGRTTQVFINLVDNSGTLDAQGFAPFAHVVEGMDVVQKIGSTPTSKPQDRPVKPIAIESVTIERS